MSELITRIDALLPQTQCQQCGFPRCRDYAEALALGDTQPNRCPPGGEFTLLALTQLLGASCTTLDPEVDKHVPRLTVHIDESRCIGCTLCIGACPVDAILGSAKRMHSVFEEECTGCLLCLPACPVDCIDTAPWSAPDIAPGEHWPEYPQAQVDRARTRVDARLQRLARLKHAKRSSRRDQGPDSETIREEIRAAVERAKQKQKNRRT